MSQKKVVIVGSGPGSLVSAMILAHHGYAVDVFEKQPYLGGRNADFIQDGFRFDLGPTFLMMNFILEEVFELTGRNVNDYMDIRSIDPLYRLKFGEGKEFFPTRDRKYLKEQMDRLFPGEYEGYLKYMKYEEKKFRTLAPCLKVPYLKLSDYLSLRLMKALPIIDAHHSLYHHLSHYFHAEHLKLAFTFQAKYLGMSPWDCPATFSIISYIEHSGGIHHPIGGLNEITKSMAKVVEEEGGKIHLSKGVDEILVRNGEAVGVRLEGGEEVAADSVVAGSDFGTTVNELFAPGVLKKWSPAKVAKKGFSCSAYMLYLGLDKVYDIPHHTILFAEDYKRNVDEISRHLVASDDPSIYVQNACVTDPNLAPEGQSTLYVLVPTANNRSGIPWAEEDERYREKVLDILETRGELTDLRKHIVSEKRITPDDWEKDKGVYRGAVFNLAHTMDQMLYFRPHNEFEDVKNCYLAGGGTHPGSGLPTIFDSGRISAGLILQKDAWFLY